MAQVLQIVMLECEGGADSCTHCEDYFLKKFHFNAVAIVDILSDLRGQLHCTYDLTVIFKNDHLVFG